MKHTKNIAVTLTFLLTLALGLVACLWSGSRPAAYSQVEKRPLAQFPKDVTWQSLVDKTSIEQFEDFTVDQFPARQFFRAVKARFVMKVLGQKQNNGYAMEDGSIAQIKTSFDQANIDYSLGRLANISTRYPIDRGRLYLAIVPDKNYFFAKDYGYPGPDYEALVKDAQERLPDATYIDLFPHLSLSDYYKTDWHWDQSRLLGVLDVLGEGMGFADALPDRYDTHILSPYRGGYHDQSALYPPPEALTYLTNDIINACTVHDLATGETTGVYIPALFESNTGYDFFLSGMKGLQRIDNPLATTDRELIVLRDSFGSSILPLIAQGYRTVWVVDIRNVLPTTLGTWIDFSGKDVLFLFSTTVLDSKTFK
jgi:hypothetical protein